MRRMACAILTVTVPETIMMSAWRGEARLISMPNRERSKREFWIAMYSIAQHARPNVTELGHRARNNHDVGLARRGPIDLHAEPRKVETRILDRHVLDSAARQAKRDRARSPCPKQS